LYNNTDQGYLNLLVGNPLYEYADLFVTRANGTIDSLPRQGIAESRNKLYGQRDLLYRLSIAPKETVTCFMKIHGSVKLNFPARIVSQESLARDTELPDLLAAVYFGIMLALLLYNLFVLLVVKEWVYFYYCLYTFWVAITQAALTGFGHRFLWGSSEWLSLRMVHIAGAASGISTLLFVRSYLHTAQSAPRLHKVLWVFMAMPVIGFLLACTSNLVLSYQIIDLNAGLGCLFVLITALYLRYHGSRSANFFLIAWTSFLVSVIIFVLKGEGIVETNFFTDRVLQIGSAIEAILLSFALADRINTLKKEKEASQARELAIAQENEKLVREQNIQLEKKVKERTVDLRIANDELAKTLSHLKETQTQMVEQEKMASLGQLTAGIAHEINNPINFVTSNIKPLKRDVKQVFELFSEVERIGLEEKPVEEKVSAIKALKQDADFDYLKEEIEILLQGMHEGSNRTAEIVKGLRIFSRLDEDDLKRASVIEGLDSTCLIINNLLNNRIELRKEYEEVPIIECYPGKLNQVFLNLMTNAIHAVRQRWGNESGGYIRIGTKRLENDTVCIFIHDNGSGMTESTKHKLFEPFFTTKEVGEGTGLGLSIVYNTMKKHNGQIEVDSELGVGTTFTLILPLAQVQDSRKQELSVA
jgi:hypothetical protein